MITRKASFGQEKNRWLDSLLFSLRARPITKHLRDVPPPRSIADLGCGYRGNFLRMILAQLPSANHAVGVDLSVDPNPALDKRIRLVRGDLNGKIPLESESFDIVFSTAVLEHLNNYEEAVNEMRRILKPGGALFLTTPAPASKPILEFISYRLGLIDEAEIRDHKRYFSRRELSRLFARHGFKNVKTVPFQMGLNSLVVCKK